MALLYGIMFLNVRHYKNRSLKKYEEFNDVDTVFLNIYL